MKTLQELIEFGKQSSFDDVEKWLNTQPADKTWEFSNPRNCVIANFFRDSGNEIPPGEFYYVILRVPWLDSFNQELAAWKDISIENIKTIIAEKRSLHQNR